MFRAIRVRASDVRPVHLTATLLACLFLLSIDGVIPQPVSAGVTSGQMAAVRRSQDRAASTMRRTDIKIKSLQRAKKMSRTRASAAARQLRNIGKRRDRVKGRLSRAVARVDLATMDRDRKLRVHPNPLGVQIADKPKLRKRVRELRSSVRKIDRKMDRLQRKMRRSMKVRRSRSRAMVRIKQRIERKSRKQQRAESALGSSISRMVKLAQRRAAKSTTARPGRSGFRRPARGYISQGYSRSHDGIDIAIPRGARVRASATGYVAYVGWNPWDEGPRAFVVIIGHAGGYETIYGHLLPIRDVRAGQLVKKGQVVGRAGSTGRSTGPHVHWEVSRGFRTLNPRTAGR
ncbi:MAG: peptidoglycan DD-metalloendopeptidase family protein [Chloroflexota bacterium]